MLMRLERGPIPLYYQLAWTLRTQIHTRRHRPNARLPTEMALMRMYGVSRTTVRLAFQLLLKDAMVRRIPGRGTFVADDPGRHPAQWTVGTMDEIITSAARLRYRYRLIDIRDIRAPAPLARLFGLPVGSPVTELHRLRLVDGRPFFHVTLHVPRDLASDIPRARLHKHALFTLLEEHCGIRIVAAHQWMSAALAEVDVARHLGLQPGDPVLRIERHYVDERGRIVEVTVDRYRTDRVRYYLRLQRQVQIETSSRLSDIAFSDASNGRRSPRSSRRLPIAQGLRRRLSAGLASGGSYRAPDEPRGL